MPLYFKVLKGTDLYDKLDGCLRKEEEARIKIREIVAQLGGIEFASNSRNAVDIGAIQFEEKPDGWAHRGEKWQRLFMPKANNKEAWKVVNAAPCVTFDERNDAIGFAQGTQEVSGGIAWLHSYGLGRGKDCMVLQLPSGFKAPADMIEITHSEWDSLKLPQPNF